MEASVTASPEHKPVVPVQFSKIQPRAANRASQAMSDELLTAHHEAAHAFITLYLGQRVMSVTIIADEDDDFAGCTIIRQWAGITPVDKAMLLLAGIVADRMNGRTDMLSSGWYDIEALADLRLPRVLIETLTHYVAEVLEANWAAVEALAKQLSAKGRLTGVPVKKIYDKAAITRVPQSQELKLLLALM